MKHSPNGTLYFTSQETILMYYHKLNFLLHHLPLGCLETQNTFTSKTIPKVQSPLTQLPATKSHLNFRQTDSDGYFYQDIRRTKNHANSKDPLIAEDYNYYNIQYCKHAGVPGGKNGKNSAYI